MLDARVASLLMPHLRLRFMTSNLRGDTVAPDLTTPLAAAEHRGRTRFAFLAETSRCLSDSLDLETTLSTVAQIALPQFGVW